MGEDWKKGPYRHFHRRGVFFGRLTAERFVTWLKART